MVLLNEKKEIGDKLKTLTDEMNEMATQLEEKDAQLKTLTDEINKMAAQCKTQLEENNVSDITKCKEQLHNLRKNTVESTKLMECSICSDIYKVPVMLPCGHAFCMNCCYMSVKARYVTGAASFDSCMLCSDKFQFNDVKRLFNSFDLLTGNLAEAKQKYCNDDINFFNIEEWKDEQKKGNDAWTEIKTVPETRILKKWDKLKGKESSEEYMEMISTIERTQSLLYMWLKNYPTTGFVTVQALSNPDAEQTSDDEKSFDSNDQRQLNRDKVKYLLHRGIIPRHLLTVGNKSGTKDASVERMINLKYSTQDVNEAEAAFKKWKKHLYKKYDYDNPIFNDKQRNSDEQECFDSFIFAEFKCYFSWNMTHQTRQAMYALKNSLRRNWRLLGFEPHFFFFGEGEEVFCYKKNQDFFNKVIQKKKNNSLIQIPSDVSSSEVNQNTRRDNKRHHSDVDRSHNNDGSSGQRPNDNEVKTSSYSHNGRGNTSSSVKRPYYHEGKTHSYGAWNRST